MDQNTENPNPSLPGVIYVGRTEGELSTVIGKVGMVENPNFLEGRGVSYRVADRIFHFVLEAAFAVELPANVSVLNVEGWVHSCLEGQGLMRFGENFVAPDGNMTFLARMVAEALSVLGHNFVSLDIDTMQARARALNSKTWQKLRKKKKGQGACPYNAWLDKQSWPPQSVTALARPRNHVRNVLALGYLVKDLASGSGLECIKIPMYRGGDLKIYPSTLEAASFEAKAEIDLNFPSTTRFSACPTSLGQVPVQPHAMTMLLGSNLETIEVPNTFLSPTKDNPEAVRFSTDHLAALGLIGGKFDEGCLYEGLGVRAALPLNLYPFVLQHPDALPGIRFWLGVQHCAKEGFRIQDFDLPACLGQLWEQAANPVDVMAKAGCPVPVQVQDWVANAWIPSRV